MMHQQAKKRPTADEILERLRELDKTLKKASKKPNREPLTSPAADISVSSQFCPCL